MCLDQRCLESAVLSVCGRFVSAVFCAWWMAYSLAYHAGYLSDSLSDSLALCLFGPPSPTSPRPNIHTLPGSYLNNILAKKVGVELAELLETKVGCLLLVCVLKGGLRFRS